MSIEDDARSGRPKKAVYRRKHQKIHKIILNDRKVKLIDIAETLKISKKRLEHIVHEYLDMQKLCVAAARGCCAWLLRVLTIKINNMLMIRSNV
jgi:hypothetical protein